MPECDYQRLATEIVQSEGWKSLPQKSGRARSWAVGRMMHRGLNDG
ncbi:hypothetical protein SFHH103_04145 (plasmid) [Sinorhizobium fredii HH103]|uniref:Uncharacterized protein n=1 Tax=Sinorhizobium fredii (strain HH103) TaxID=1117943 RepID=G9AC56_SINF1|nr:hypothetical protein SFHH103_04145 [Sinorhizobium fredii HH103]